MGKKSIITMALVLCTALFFSVKSSDAGEIFNVDDVIPSEMQVQKLDGSDIAVKDVLSGSYTAIQFMTTACRACQSELKDLIKLSKQLKGKLDIVAISMDLLGAKAVNAYEARYKLGVTYYLDSGFSLPPQFGFPYTPSFLVVDNGGKIIYKNGGYVADQWSKVAEDIKSAMQ